MHPGYGSLVALAEAELELVREGQLGALPQLWEDRQQVVAALPPIPPADALSSLERRRAALERLGLLLQPAHQLVVDAGGMRRPPALLVHRSRNTGSW